MLYERQKAIYKCKVIYIFIAFQKFMREIGVLSDSLQYDLFRNIPVDTKSEIFRRIGQWSVQGNPRLQYLSPNIESKLLFENRTLKLGMPFVSAEMYVDWILPKVHFKLKKYLKYVYLFMCFEVIVVFEMCTYSNTISLL